MPFIMKIAVISVLLVLVTAVPTVPKRSAFSIQQKVNPGHVRNGAASKAKALAKFGTTHGNGPGTTPVNEPGPTPGNEPGTTPGNEPGVHKTSGSVTTVFDSDYICPITIGGSTFSFDFDTSHSNFWVFGKIRDMRFQKVYTPGPTAKEIHDATWGYYLGDDTSDEGHGDETRVEGIVYKDTVAIGDVIVTDQAFGVATEASKDLQESPANGIIGLSFKDLQHFKPKQKSWLQSAVDQGMPALFAADFAPNSPGFWDFGAIHSVYSNSHITYIEVDQSEDFWSIKPDSVTIGDWKDIEFDGRAVIDSGTTLLLLDEYIVKHYYDRVRGARYSHHHNGWIFPCGATLPEFTITVNGYKAVIPGNYFNFSFLKADDWEHSGEIKNECFGGIQEKEHLSVSIFGTEFIKSLYVVFDATGNDRRIGFTQKIDRNPGSGWWE